MNDLTAPNYKYLLNYLGLSQLSFVAYRVLCIPVDTAFRNTSCEIIFLMQNNIAFNYIIRLKKGLSRYL